MFFIGSDKLRHAKMKSSKRRSDGDSDVQHRWATKRFFPAFELRLSGKPVSTGGLAAGGCLVGCSRMCSCAKISKHRQPFILTRQSTRTPQRHRGNSEGGRGREGSTRVCPATQETPYARMQSEIFRHESSSVNRTDFQEPISMKVLGLHDVQKVTRRYDGRVSRGEIRSPDPVEAPVRAAVLRLPSLQRALVSTYVYLRKQTYVQTADRRCKRLVTSIDFSDKSLRRLCRCSDENAPGFTLGT